MKTQVRTITNPDKRTQTIIEETTASMTFRGENDVPVTHITLRTARPKGLSIDLDASGTYPTGKNWDV